MILKITRVTRVTFMRSYHFNYVMWVVSICSCQVTFVFILDYYSNDYVFIIIIDIIQVFKKFHLTARMIILTF